MVPVTPASSRTRFTGTKYEAEPSAMPVDWPSPTRVAAPLATSETRSLQRLHSPAIVPPSVSAKSSLVRCVAPTSRVVWRAHCACAALAQVKHAKTASVMRFPGQEKVCCRLPGWC